MELMIIMIINGVTLHLYVGMCSVYTAGLPSNYELLSNQLTEFSKCLIILTLTYIIWNLDLV